MTQQNGTLGGLRTPAGAMTPKFELGRDFSAINLLPSFISYVYSFGSYRVDKQTDAAENI